MTSLVYGYIERFMSISFDQTNMKPMRCRLRGARTARLLTLVDGEAFNFQAPGSTAPKQYPVEQTLDCLVKNSTPGDGATINSLLQTVMANQGKQGTLQVRVPGGGLYSCQAVFDYAEINEDGYMGSDLTNWSIIAFFFQQMTEWGAV